MKASQISYLAGRLAVTPSMKDLSKTGNFKLWVSLGAAAEFTGFFNTNDPARILSCLFQDVKFSPGDACLICVKAPESRSNWPLGNGESTCGWLYCLDLFNLLCLTACGSRTKGRKAIACFLTSPKISSLFSPT